MFLAELNIVVLYGPAMTHLSVYTNELKITLTQKPARGMFTEALFMIAKTEATKMPFSRRIDKQLWDIQPMEYYQR